MRIPCPGWAMPSVFPWDRARCACSALVGALRAAAGRIFEHALIEEQAPCQRVRSLPESGNLLKHDEIGDKVHNDEERCAKGTLPASWHTAHTLAPLTAGTCGQTG